MRSEPAGPGPVGRTLGGIAVTLAAFAAAGGRAAAEPTLIDLGGPRQTQVAITAGPETYVLAVQMRAVSSFDAASDREANRSLARGAALTALARHLAVGPRQDLALSGLVAGAEAVDEGRFRLTFTVPAAGVKVVDRPPEQSAARFDPEFAAFLKADPLLIETEGAKVILLDDGRVLVLGVASSALTDGSAADRRRAETIARQRALAHIVAEKTGVQVARAETSAKRTTVTIDDAAGERAESVAEYLETTQAKVRGATRDFPIVGRWTSDDGTLFSVAVGGFVEREAGRGE